MLRRPVHSSVLVRSSKTRGVYPRTGLLKSRGAPSYSVERASASGAVLLKRGSSSSSSSGGSRSNTVNNNTHSARAYHGAGKEMRAYQFVKPKEEMVAQAELIVAAAQGNIAKMAHLLAQNKCDINSGDYDLRTALHLAAAEGHVEACKLLIEHKANINPLDRDKCTPLEAALTHDSVITYLKLKGGTLHPSRKDTRVKSLLQAAARGDIEHMRRLLHAGVDIKQGDYDARTALHLAAAEGRLDSVRFLLAQGADVHAVDRFGNTPLADAQRGVGATFHSVMEELQEAGAVFGRHLDFSGPALATSAKQSLQIFCERGKFAHVEAWLPARGSAELLLAEWFADPKYFELLSAFGNTTNNVIGNSTETPWGKAWVTQKPVTIESATPNCLLARYDQAQDLGLTRFTIFPIVHQGRCFGLIACFPYRDLDGNYNETETLSTFHTFLNRILAAGVYGITRTPEFDTPSHIPKGQQEEVFKLVAAPGLFNHNLVYNEVDWFYKMGLETYYFRRFSAEVLAGHVMAYIAAKKLATTTGDPEKVEFYLEDEDGHVLGKLNQDLVMVPDSASMVVEAEQKIVKKIASLPKENGCSLEYFLSSRSPIPGGRKMIGIYVLQKTNYVDPKLIGATGEWDINKIATDLFLKDKTPGAKERYQDIIKTTVGGLAPAVKMYNPHDDGTIPLLFAFYAPSGARASHFPNLTELLKQFNLIVKRKFIETFANGVVVYSLYVVPPEEDVSVIAKLIQSWSIIHLISDGNLSKLFLSGEYNAEEYAYCSAVARFVYYFLNERSEELDALSRLFSKDTLNLGRLKLWHTSLKREAVSRQRIAAVISTYRKVCGELARDFDQRISTNWKLQGLVPPNAALEKQIRQEATNPLDLQILLAMYAFNRSVVKTNFKKSRKSTLAFRLDPTLLAGYDWPTRPFAIFFVIGPTFQGFHVRFSDVSRGGIRLIRSRDRHQYQTNLALQFSENYGLAYTQNKKNKDIPEFGAKGTILLNDDAQAGGFEAFQKYIDGLLDLLTITPESEVIDNYGKPELLFLGPDEGTADMMAWAAQYAKERGYPYWRSFTTGKPDSMGGIPHDTYGMTTRSVHRYVVGCLQKLGLQEEQVTKVQTGGPDGDLGSNEILLSKDKTIAIVDGSGVLYDPAGINRQELVRLAKIRKMISEFDVKKLGQGGFRVLTSDQNVTLPTGELVVSGLAFRNEFHLHPLSSADLFVPCGGRPDSVNVSNVRELFTKDKKPRFKIIVEGANLFFTNDARMVLEDAGVILYKDASTNKGGVTSSSLEVLAALALNEKQFEEHMAVKPGRMPEFYKRYVAEIQARIEADAALEFECIWKEHLTTKMHRFQLTDLVSDKINELNEFISKSALWPDQKLRDRVLGAAIPASLQQLVSLNDLYARVPQQYLKAIFCAYLASRYVYKYGVKGTEFAFFDFMQQFIDKKHPLK